MRQRMLSTVDGAQIAVRLFEPQGEQSRQAAVLIGGAMGARQDYYRPFAEWLAIRGYVVATFDYRGSGESRPSSGSLKNFQADLFDWATDTDTVIDALSVQFRGLPICLVGHSLGAQLPGLLHSSSRLGGMLSIAAGSGYWRQNAPKLRLKVLYFWHLVVPLATAIFGYFPGRRMGMVGDLPKGVVLQWRKWCLNPGYHVGAEGNEIRAKFESIRFPIIALSVSDDELMTESGTRALLDCYASAQRRIERVSPSELKVRRIGHFGFFRDEFRSSLWPRAEQWIRGLSARDLN